MVTNRFTVMPLLLALAVGIASMPTNIYQFCQRNVGTLEIEPWRIKSLGKSLRAQAASLAGAIRAFFASEAGRQSAVVAATLVMALVLSSHPHASEGVMGVAIMGHTSQLKLTRQRAAELDAELKAAKSARAAIGNAALTENRAMTADEKAEFTAGATKIAGIEARIEENNELLAAAVAANEALRTAAPPAANDGDTAASANAAATAGIQMGEDRTTKAPGYFGRQLQAVRKAALVLKGGDESLTSEDRALLKPMQAAATGANTDVPSDGGFLVGQQRTSTILQRAYETGEILSRVNRMPIGAGFNGAKVPAIDETSRADNSRFGGIVSGWLGQGNTLSSGKPKFREIDLKLRKVGAFVYSTDEMNVDSVLFEAWVNRNLPLELTFRTEDAVVNGVGGNQPLGLLQSPAVISVTRNSAGRVKSEDLRAMWKRMWAPLRKNAVWLIDQSVEEDIDQAMIAAGTGAILDPSYKPATSENAFATYKGRPIIPVEYCAALGTAGDVVLANLDEYMLIDKGGVDQAVSLHVAFLTDEAVYRFMYRVDGQCTWNAALTPKSGGSTLSPVIALTT